MIRSAHSRSLPRALRDEFRRGRGRGTGTSAVASGGVSTMGQLRFLLAGRHRAVAALAIASIVSGFTESGVLAVLAQSATALVNHVTRVDVRLGALDVRVNLGVLLLCGLALALARLLLQIPVSLIPARMVADQQARLRTGMFGAFTRASWSEQSNDREGHLQELVTSQIVLGNQTVAQATTLVVSLLAFVVLLASALTLSPLAALVVLVAAGGLFGLLRPLSSLGAYYGRAASRQSLRFAGGINEAIRVAEEAHVFGAGAAQRAQINESVAPLRISWGRASFLARLVPAVYQSLIYILVVAALGALYLIGNAQVASLTAVVLILVRAGMYGQQSQAAYTSLVQALPYIDRIRQAHARYVASVPKRGNQRLDSVRSIAFKSVTFSYQPDRPVLSNVDFEVQAGEAIGVVGPSGAGKSTLVQILLRLREPVSGHYFVNGMPAGEICDDDWHVRFAYVPQEPRLLHASVTDNIRFFRAVGDAAIQRAARLAGIHHDVMSWPAGYDTVIGPRADAISGGQKQRICLARALAGDPHVLILDEPTSALDAHSEAVIRESLAQLRHDLTIFIVAHRASTLEICERVMVVVDGRLEAFDRVDSLRGNAYYRSMSGESSAPPENLVRNGAHAAGRPHSDLVRVPAYEPTHRSTTVGTPAWAGGRRLSADGTKPEAPR